MRTERLGKRKRKRITTRLKSKAGHYEPRGSEIKTFRDKYLTSATEDDIKLALNLTDGNQKKAAKLLAEAGISTVLFPVVRSLKEVLEALPDGQA